MNKEDEPSLELIVTQININPGYNDDLMDKCPTLKGYMIYVDKIREFQKTMSLEEAVNKAVNYCISNGILVDFLIENKSEVVNMSIFEYDEQLHEETMKEIGREEGFQQGIKETLDMSIKATISMLRELKCSDEQIVEQLVTKLNIDVKVAEEYVYGKK